MQHENVRCTTLYYLCILCFGFELSPTALPPHSICLSVRKGGAIRAIYLCPTLKLAFIPETRHILWVLVRKQCVGHGAGGAVVVHHDL